MKDCPECDSRDPDNSLFCGRCGASLQPAQGTGGRGLARAAGANRPQLYQSCLNVAAGIFLVCLLGCAAIVLCVGKGCREGRAPDRENSGAQERIAGPRREVPIQPSPPLRPIFDVARLLTLRYAQIRRALGNPQSSFSPTAEMLRLDPTMTWSDTFERGSIQLQMDYDPAGRVVYAFLSDSTCRKTTNELMQLGNLDAYSRAYTTRAQAAWDPHSRTFSETKITGVHIYPRAPYARDEWGKPI
jgi:hypothetical protein